MNTIKISLLLFVIHVGILKSQSLTLQTIQMSSPCEYIINGNFESAQCCGVINNSINLSDGWSGISYYNLFTGSWYTSTPDLFYNNSILGFSSDLNIPSNYYGNQSDDILINGNIYSGNGYLGIFAYSEPTGTYEGIKTDLVDTLRNEITYVLKYYTSSAEVSNCASFLSARLTSSFSSNQQVISGNSNFTDTDWKLRAYSFTATDNYNVLELTGHSGLGLIPQPTPQLQNTSFPYFSSPLSGDTSNNYSYIYLDTISLKPLADLGPDIVSSSCNEQIHIISCLDPNYTYQWYKYNSNTNTWLTIGNNLNYLTINSTAYDKYKLVVTYNQDGITFTGSDEIIVSSPFCCSTGSELTTAYGDYSSSNFPFATNGPGNTKLISNSTLALNGSLTIDQNTVISASHLQLNSQYKITVLNGKTLTINAGSVLEGCTYRWNGIEVQPGGQIYVQDNSLLKDADYAIDIKNNSQLSSIYNITKTQFSKNYYSIRITNQLNFGSNYIDGCYFSCNSQMLPSTNILTDSSQHFSVKGISLYNCKANVGTYAYPNEFNHTKIGVEALYCTSIKFINNFFNNSNAPYLMEQGVYVRASEVNFIDSNKFKSIKYGINTSASSNSNYRNLRVRPTVINSNRFISCENGIYIGYCMNAQIENNSFVNCFAKGVNCYRSKGINSSGSAVNNGALQLYPNNFYIRGNNFRDCLNSIELAYVSNANIEISKNNISHASQGNSTNLNEGIRYTNVENIPNNTLNSRCLIYMNTITDAYRGIVISGGGNSMINSTSGKFNCKMYDNTIKVRVWDHTQNPPYTETYGIFIQNCKKAEVVGNSIFSSLISSNISTWPSYATKGIRFDNSPLCFTSCNNLQNIGDNIWYRGSSISQVIQNNTFDNPYHAILLESDIGKQPIDGDINNKVQDNRWINMTPNATKTLNICTNVPTTIFYYRNAPSFGMNSSDLVLGNSCNGIFSTGLVILTNSPINNLAECLNTNLITEDYIQFFESFNDSYSAFTSNISSEEIERMYLSGIDFYKILKYNPLIVTYNSAFAEYKDQMDSTDLASIINIQEQANWPMDSILADSLLNQLNALDPTRESDIWKIKLYQILLAHQELNEEIKFSDIEIAELTSIAEQCPYTSGEAVYESRALLRIYNSTTIEYKNACEEGYYEPNNTGSRLASSSTSVQVLSLDGPMEIQMNESAMFSEKEQLVLYSALGVEIERVNYTKGQGTISLQNLYLHPGVYLIKSSVSFETIKIIIN